MGGHGMSLSSDRLQQLEQEIILSTGEELATAVFKALDKMGHDKVGHDALMALREIIEERIRRSDRKRMKMAMALLDSSGTSFSELCTLQLQYGTISNFQAAQAVDNKNKRSERGPMSMLLSAIGFKSRRKGRQ